MMYYTYDRNLEIEIVVANRQAPISKWKGHPPECRKRIASSKILYTNFATSSSSLRVTQEQHLDRDAKSPRRTRTHLANKIGYSYLVRTSGGSQWQWPQRRSWARSSARRRCCRWDWRRSSPAAAPSPTPPALSCCGSTSRSSAPALDAARRPILSLQRKV